MAFEQVNVTLLRSSIQDCLSSISDVKVKQIASSLADHQVWQTRAADQFNEKINQLLEEQIPTLTTDLKKGLQLADLIEQYQSDQEKIEELEDRIEDLSSEEDPPKKRIRSMKATIREYKSEMLELERKANELVS